MKDTDNIKWYLLQASKLQENRGGETTWKIIHQGKNTSFLNKIMKHGTENWVYCIQYEERKGALIQVCQIGKFDYEKQEMIKHKRNSEILTELVGALEKIMIHHKTI